MATNARSTNVSEDQINQVPEVELQNIGISEATLSNKQINVANQQASMVPGADGPDTKRYMSGWRLYMVILGLCLSLLLSTLETTIVSTSLVSITNALSGFEDRDWVVTSYMLTYTGFLVIYAKFSDILGAKFMVLLALLVLTVFSIACGAANGMTELIILRAFQGVGGSGIYSMVGVVVLSIVPQREFAKYMAIISSVLAISSILGPLLGGLINDGTTWRWVFLLNAPGGAAATALLVFFLPSKFSVSDQSILTRLRRRFTISALSRLDLVGAMLLLAASILVVFALEEAGIRYSWGSATIVVTLIISLVSWVLFVGWEIILEKKGKAQEPIFPMRLLKGRFLSGMLLCGFLAGFPFSVVVVNLPQRLQALYLSSPTSAGISLLPLLLLSPFASGLTGYLSKNLRVPPIYIITAGSIFQLLGVCLLSTLDTDPNGWQETRGKMYGYEVLMGMGFGFLLTSLLVMIPLVAEEKDQNIMIGAVTQVRVLGGTIGLAVSKVALDGYVKPRLREKLSEEQVLALGKSLSSLGGLSPDEQVFVRRVFGDGYQRQIKILTAFSAAVVLSCLLMWEKVPRRHQSDEQETTESTPA